jgi:formate dehydrogenase major subunit
VLDDRVPHGTLELNAQDADALGVRHGDCVSVRSRRGRIELPVNVTDNIIRGTVFLAFHFKEHPANALTIAALDPVARIPEFKVCAVRIEASPAN